MCGRFTLTVSSRVLADVFQTSFPEVSPRYNIAPTQQVLTVRGGGDGRATAPMRWGLIPHWAEDERIGHRLINARSETAPAKPAFRTAFHSCRCLIPADGFYEWQKTASGKAPHLIRRADGAPFAMAGLWSRWRRSDGEPPVESCTILTCPPNELVARLHDRMPVILPPGSWNRWLDSASDPVELTTFLAPAPADEMESYRVPRTVNDPRHDGPDCVRRLDEQASLW